MAVNDLLRREFISRAIKPKVLVVTHGATPSEAEIGVVLGWGAEDKSSRSWLRLNAGGAFGMEDHQTWEWFGK